MTWEEKLSAMQAIWDVSLRMRRPGDWYVNARNRDIGGDGTLVGSYGNGATPEEAVNDDWKQCVEELPTDRYLVCSGEQPRHYRWQGFMWREIPVEK